MSVTSQLQQPGSPLASFFERELPASQPVLTALNRELLEHPLLFPPASFRGGDWGTVGTAFDLRVRCYFSQSLPEARSAARGADLAADLLADGDRERYLALVALWERALATMRTDLDRVAPAGRRLSWTDEDVVNAHCLVLALFEQCARAGPQPDFPAVVALGEALEREMVEPILELPREMWLEDVRQLSWCFHDTQRELLHRRAVLNPVFAGSFEAGGADADLIVEDCLLEVKSTKNPLRKVDLYEALAYVLLDYDDGFHIERVALYAARRGALVGWPLATLLPILTKAEPKTLAQLRAELHDALTPDFVKAASEPWQSVLHELQKHVPVEELTYVFERCELRTRGEAFELVFSSRDTMEVARDGYDDLVTAAVGTAVGRGGPLRYRVSRRRTS